MGELGRFTAYVRTNLLYARTQRFARNAAYTAVPPRRAHYTLQSAELKVSKWVITLPQKCLSLAADSRVCLCKSLLCGEPTSPMGDVSRDSKGRSTLGTRLWYKV